jgi:hexosaminidase
VTILMGIWAGYMQLGPMAIEAPLQKIGAGFKGQIRNVRLSGEVAS